MDQAHPEIIIVSGLPRSGTSLMMKILETGGIPVVTDHARKSDTDNPGGYYEFEKVKKIREDASWLKDTRGKAVKMVSMLLLDLPSWEAYKIIFMERNTDEILNSQQTMLKRKNIDPDRDNSAIAMAGLFRKHLQTVHGWLERQSNIDVLKINYNTLMLSPGVEIRRIISFLKVPLDGTRMRASIDPALYRNRSEMRDEAH